MGDFTGQASADVVMQLLREGKVHECISCLEKVIEINTTSAYAWI